MERMKSLVSVLAGNLVFALGVAMFIEPCGLVSGGVTGIGLILQNYFGFSLSATAAVINGSCLVIGFLLLGKGFAASATLSSFAFPFFLTWIEKIPGINAMADDLFFCTIMAGLLSGLGFGLVLRERASSGGLDVLFYLLNRHFGISISKSMMVLNCILLLIQSLFSDLKQVVYGLIVVALTSMTLDKVLQMGRHGTQILVVSGMYEEIRRRLLENNFGLTLVPMESGYQRNQWQAVLCAVHPRRISEVKRIVEETDPNAFVLVSSVSEVMGRGFTIPR